MLIKIKRFKDVVATGKFTVVAGKLPLEVTLEDVCDFEGEILEACLGTGCFDIATQQDVEDLGPEGTLFDMEDYEAAKAIEGMTPTRKFNPRNPKNVAIEKAIEQYGGVDDVPESIRRALGGRLAMNEENADGTGQVST